MAAAEVFQLMGTIGVNNKDAVKALKEVGAEGASSENRLAGVFSKIGHGAAVLGKTMLKGIAVGGTALAGLTIKAVNMAGELEQNLGGSEAVFGAFAGQMQDMAKGAFATMGLSMSDTMATANKMGALFQGSGFSIQESASMSAEVMQRAADVASIMGIDSASAMEAVAGAAKGNFTMMDNLGVAMNDTALAAYAQSKGIETSTASMSQQEKVALAMEMFLDKTSYAAGNYAKENDTLAGSLSTAKASMSNFLSGAGDIDDVISSFTQFGTIAVGMAAEMLPSLVSGLTEMVGALAQQLPGLLETLLPAIIEGATTLLTSLVTMAPQIIGIILEMLPSLIDGVMQLVLGVVSALPQIVSALLEKAPEIIRMLVGALVDALPMLISGAIELVMAVVGALPEIIMALVEAAPTIILGIVNALIDALPQLVAGLVQLVTMIVPQIPTIIMALIQSIPEIVQGIIAAIIENIPMFIKAGIDLCVGLWEGIKSFFAELWNGIKTLFEPIANIFSALWEGIKAKTTAIWDSIKTAISNVWNGIKSGVSTAINAVSTTISNVFNGIKATVSNVWNGIKTAITGPIEAARAAVKKAIDKIKSFFSFKITWPKIPIPRFAITPAGWKIGDLLKGSIPKLSISWQAKGGILDGATIFGMMGDTLLGGGESGREAVLPLNRETLGGIGEGIAATMRTDNAQLAEKLDAVIAAIRELQAFISGLKVVMDTGALVGQTRREMNRQLGFDGRLSFRGVTT